MNKKNESEKKLTWVRISPTLSDETVTFCVEGCAGWKLRAFIDYVLERQSSHCGTFRVVADGEHPHLVCKVEYSDRTVRSCDYYGDYDNLQVLGAVVSRARCNGGWGQMNYNVYVVQL